MKILVINCGSSSIKYKLYDMKNEIELCSGLLERVGTNEGIVNHKKNNTKYKIEMPLPDYETGIKNILENIQDHERGAIKDISELKAIGHRVVHGAETFSGSQLITNEVIQKMEECVSLAPLHNPPNLAGIYAIKKILPNIPQCGVFDTAFHQTMPPEAYLYAIPYEFYTNHGIRRYGFHGTSHLFVSQESEKLLGKPYNELKLVTCHLGNGSSMTAVVNGKSVDTSMGMTPLEGLVMGTRCGDLDPALPLIIMEREKLDPKGVDNILNKKSGLLGLCGKNDSRDVEEAMDKNDQKAWLAHWIFCRRIKKYIGAYAAIMGGLDAVIFTAGIGENSEYVRRDVCLNMEFLGIKIDEAKNKAHSKEARDISKDDAKVRVLIIPTNEELVIARDTMAIVSKL